jgi:hypothetical protein
MAAPAQTRLPVGLAIRLLLDSVSYSNALPPWFETLTIDYAARERRIRQEIDRYERGTNTSLAFEVSVPKRTGGKSTWIVPSVNDQIICQACISSFAYQLERVTLDRARVFGVLLNTDPTRLAFLEDQVQAWSRFSAFTQQRCLTNECMLQIDIKEAFRNIAPQKVFEFVRKKCGDLPAIRLLEKMLADLSSPTNGFPFINDGVFFVGNTYLSEVDQAVGNVNPDFVRFVDDYRLFGPSTSALETQLAALRPRLREIGFEINEAKLKLGTGTEYLEAVSRLQDGATEKTQYIDAAVQPGVFRAEDMLAQIKQSLLAPDEYLHQGFARLLMAAIRRMRVRALFSDEQGYSDSPADQFETLLSTDAQAIDLICELLEGYAQDASNAWRLIWILNVCKSITFDSIPDRASRVRLEAVVERIGRSNTLPMVVRLWSSTMPGFPSPQRLSKHVEELHDLDYVAQGIACYGS